MFHVQEEVRMSPSPSNDLNAAGKTVTTVFQFRPGGLAEATPFSRSFILFLNPQAARFDKSGWFISGQCKSARLVHLGLEGQAASWEPRWACELNAPVTSPLGLAMD